jgi:hypothetical protein
MQSVVHLFQLNALIRCVPAQATGTHELAEQALNILVRNHR